MSTTQFCRDSLARWYAEQHLKTDPGLVAVYYLPTNSDEREIRLVEVNQLIAELADEALEPIDFGVEMGTENAHRLLVVDVTPAQWERIKRQEISLPENWSLEDAVHYGDE